jgi:MaoC like domain
VTERMEQLYLEDLRAGQRFASGTYVMEAPRIKAFAAEFDPQPVHIDESVAEATVFKGLAASGWHTAAVAMRLLVTGGLPFANGGSTLIQKQLPLGVSPFAAIELVPSLRDTVRVTPVGRRLVYVRRQRVDHSPR